MSRYRHSNTIRKCLSLFRHTIGLKNDNLILKHNFAKCRKDKSLFSRPLTLDDVLEDVYFFLGSKSIWSSDFLCEEKNSKDDLNKVKSILNSKIPTDSFLPSIRIPTRNEVRGKIGLPKKYAKKINAYLKEYNWQKRIMASSLLILPIKN